MIIDKSPTPAAGPRAQRWAAGERSGVQEGRPKPGMRSPTHAPLRRLPTPVDCGEVFRSWAFPKDWRDPGAPSRAASADRREP